MYEASPGPASDSTHGRPEQEHTEVAVDPRATDLLQRYVDAGRISVTGPEQFHQLAYYLEFVAGFDPSNPQQAEWADTLIADTSRIYPDVDMAELASAIAELSQTPDTPPAS